jgi:hypothetical protein
MLQVSMREIEIKETLIGIVGAEERKFFAWGPADTIKGLNRWIAKNLGIPIDQQRITVIHPNETQVLGGRLGELLSNYLDGAAKIEVQKLTSS